MDYNKRASKWETEMKEKDSDIKIIFISEGKAAYADRNGRSYPDAVYYCIQKNGERIAEHSWRKDDTEGKDFSGKFLLKKQKKLIFIHGEEAYGFGFNDKEQDRSIVLYLRRGCAAILAWSDADSKAVNVMYEVNEESPESLDSLIGFMAQEADSGSTHKIKESGDLC